MTAGKQTYDFNHIDDVVDGLIEALNFKKEKRIFHKFGIWHQEKKCRLSHSLNKFGKNTTHLVKLFFQN